MPEDVLDMDTATHCTGCKKPLAAVTKHGQRVGRYVGNKCVAVLCPRCELEGRLAEWRAKPELKMRLVMDAQLAESHLDCLARNGEDRHIQEVYAFVFQKYAAEYRAIMAQFNRVAEAARITEIAVWFGRPDRATPEVARASHEFSEAWVPSCLREGQPEPDFGLAPGPAAVQTYYHKATKTNHSFTHEDYTAMLMGSAGRVLLTVRDNHPEGDPKARFNGANLTLIFDEDAKHPRGGVQSLVGTEAECLGLLQALRDHPPAFAQDDNVSFG